MADFFLSELRTFSFPFAPKGWAMCNGQLLSISQNQALFSLLGTTYGGDGRTTFALPNMVGRTPMHLSNTHPLGESSGAATQTLNVTQIPAHNHFATASSNAPAANTPANNFWPSNSGFKQYGSATNAAMAGNALGNTGNGQAHENMSPYLVLNICIATIGIFPSRN